VPQYLAAIIKSEQALVVEIKGKRCSAPTFLLNQ
jgi:hypothetical protein